MTERYAGPCAGGPLHGQSMTKEAPTVHIPIVRTSTMTFDSGSYEWHATTRVWIWTGPREMMPPPQGRET